MEKTYDETRWRAEFARGGWSIGLYADRPVSLLGVTRQVAPPQDGYYLEYLWVRPECRRSNVGARMLTDVLDRLRDAGVQTAFLWVLDGNDAAVRLYKRIGFASTDYRQPLPGRPGRSEEKMRLDLNMNGGRRQLLSGTTPAPHQASQRRFYPALEL